MPTIATTILLTGLFLLLIVAAEHAARRWAVPVPAWMLSLGLGYGLIARTEWVSLPIISFSPDVIVFGFVPMLIFAAARKLPIRALRKEGLEILFLSLSGPSIGMVLLALPLVVIGQWPWPHALVFGAALSPTDPLAVSAMLSKGRVPEALKVLIEGESLFNDAVAVVLFSLVAGWALDGFAFSLGLTAGEVVVSLAGAAVLGAVAGGITGALLRWWHDLHDRFAGAVLPLVLVYTVFAIAHSVLHVSGVVAVVVCTLVLGAMHTHRHHAIDRDQRADEFFDDFWQFLNMLAGAILFFGMGAMVGSHRWLLPWILVPAVCVLLLLARVATIYPLGVGTRLLQRNLPMSWRHTMAAGGLLRGALSVALLMSLPAGYEHRTAMICLAFALLLFSLVAYLAVNWYCLRKMEFT